jgi:hypothetical protein
MKRLSNDMARCSGRYDFYTKTACPKRDRCWRYLHYAKLDREGRDEAYRSVSVMLAPVGCKHFIEVG